MTDLSERVEMLEKTIGELTFNLHVSKVAITVLSGALSDMSSEPGMLVSSYEQVKSSAPLVTFNHPDQQNYEERLRKSVLALLSKPDLTS
ncbi:hypothetical protein AB1287_13005 [Enterobacter asburiae]|uniref:hypothetical protein n=1 Tax=Scandinavium sp. UTDF21-P1B TaxID=3446379 RepID=UPI00346DF6B5